MPVYFIRSGDIGPVKIGWADDVERRRRTLQIANHSPLQVVRVIQCRRGTEQWLHRHYEAAQVRGEWFVFSSEMLTIEPPDLDVQPPPEPKPDPLPQPLRVQSLPAASYLLADCLRFAGAPPEIIAGYAQDLAAILSRREAAE